MVVSDNSRKWVVDDSGWRSVVGGVWLVAANVVIDGGRDYGSSQWCVINSDNGGWRWWCLLEVGGRR